MAYILVILGGGTGALLRYISTQSVSAVLKTHSSWGTLFVNCVGALLIGFLVNFFDMNVLSAKWRLLLVTGFLGGYTTFSAYSLETVQYFISGNVKYALINIFANNILCILLVLLGLWINNLVFSK
ncbi:MAG: fluoride efflux transporter CrcB [Treponema sp.]|nr:fluoride efflux transporter CrcB [Treponema sp.]